MSRRALGRGLDALFSPASELGSDLIEIHTDQIDSTESQPRQVFSKEALDELAASIKSNGIIQPIVVRRNGERFQIIAGERRWRAAQIAGLTKLPCIIKDVPEEDVLEISLVENIQREELNPLEEANAYKRLLEKLKTQEEVAKRVGKDRSSVANSIRLLKLPPSVQKLINENKLSGGHARALLALESAERQQQLANQVVESGLSVREVERLAKAGTSERIPAARPKSHASHVAGNANIAAAESKLSRKLGSPVRIRFGKTGGVLEVRFSSHDDLSRLFDLLMKRSAE
jgi:ParB family transcriptional regulator, chromosome partitioning protein